MARHRRRGRRRRGRRGRGDAGRARRPDRRLRARRRGRGDGIDRDRGPLRYGPGVGDVLIDADTIRSPELRHEIPAWRCLDPFLYGERDGTAFAATSPLDAEMIGAARPDAQAARRVRRSRPARAAGWRRARATRRCSSSACARAARSASTRAAVPRVPARDRRGAPRGGDRALRRPCRCSRPPPPQDRGRAGGHPARAARPRRRSRDSGRRTARRRVHTQKRAADLRARERRSCATADRGPEIALGDVHRRQRPVRPRPATAPAAARSHPGESVIVDVCAAGPRDRLLHRHRPHLRRRRAAPGARALARARPAGASPTAAETVRPGVTGRELWEQACDLFETHGLPDPAQTRAR